MSVGDAVVVDWVRASDNNGSPEATHASVDGTGLDSQLAETGRCSRYGCCSSDRRNLGVSPRMSRGRRS